MGEVKSEEPEFIRQSEPGLSMDQRLDWIRENAAAARAEGNVWGRAAWDDKREVVLLEFWKIRPSDEGAPRWQS